MKILYNILPKSILWDFKTQHESYQQLLFNQPAEAWNRYKACIGLGKQVLLVPFISRASSYLAKANE